MKSIIIIDDEHLARVLLEDYVNKIPDLELVASCSSCFEAMEIMKEQRIDLLFVDIQMPDLRGNSFVKTLKDPPMIVFTTAYPEYAVESYDLQAIDYLLKPIEFERLVQTYHKAVAEYKKPKKSEDAEDFMLIKIKHGMQRIFYKDILYIEGLKEYVLIHTTDKKRIISLQSLTKLNEVLPDAFLRIHKSYIVNKQWVNIVYGSYVIINDVKIPIGKSYKDDITDKFFTTEIVKNKK